MKTPEEKKWLQDIEKRRKELGRIYRQQYLYYGGFCGECGKAKPPYVHNLPEKEKEDACNCKTSTTNHWKKD